MSVATLAKLSVSHSCFLAACFAICILLGQFATAQDLQVPRSVEQIHRVRAEDLFRGVPVDLECIVTCYEPNWSILFVSDAKHGFYAGNIPNLSLQRGDRIRLRGVLNANRVPTNCTYEASENGIEIPSPRPVDFDWLQSGNEDSQIVEIEAQLVGIHKERSFVCLEMRASSGGRFRGLLSAEKFDINRVRRMLGKKLRLRGVVGARFDEHQRWTGFQIWLSDLQNVEEIENPGEPYELPMIPIQAMTADNIVQSNSSFFQTEGVVTYQLAHSMVLLQDNSHQLFVELINPSSVSVDRSYKMKGTLDTSVVPPILRMSEAEPSEKTFSIPQSSAIYELSELVSGEFSGQLIRIKGAYYGPFEIKGQNGFLIKSQSYLLPVFLEDGVLDDVVKGTEVEAKGIWIQQKSLVGFNIGSSALHARKSGIQLGKQIPWLLISVITGCAAVTGLSFVWVATLRQQVRNKTQQAQSLNIKLTEDLRARTVAEESLRTTTAYLDVYRKIVDQHAIVVETDTAGTILSVNDSFSRVSGYSQEELVGKNLLMLSPSIVHTTSWTEVCETVATSGYWHGEICNRHKNGPLYWVDTTIASLFDNEGTVRGFFAISADITSLKEAQVQAESANRSKSEFLANMSHEIRTPMTAILGFAEILAEERQKGVGSASQVECIDTIKRNGEHLLSIINDILDISKIEANKMTAEQIQLSPVQLVQEVVQLMQVKSNAKGLTLDTKYAAGIPKVILTDPTRLRQILVNLVGNAIKFTEMGGVTIAVRMHETQSMQICFDVIDTGIGLKEDQITTLFRSFEQADTSMTRKFGGTGLGLRISKRLAEILGGTLIASCSGERGCVFTASIAIGALDQRDLDCSTPSCDVIANVAMETEIQSQLINNPHSKSLLDCRILLVEDGPDNQRLISHLLRNEGAIVDILENGRMAVERFTVDGTLDGALSNTLEFDLILMDMQMPEMDGYEATRILRRKGCCLPILAVTAHAMDIDLAKCLDAGCDFRLTKPIVKKTLIEACAKWRYRNTLAMID